MEHELRGNSAAIKSILGGKSVVTKLNRLTWDRLYVDLALDLPEDAYEHLQTLYWVFDQTDEYYQQSLKGTNELEQRTWLEDSVESIRLAQAFVAAELHWTWKLTLYARRFRRFVTRTTG